MSYKSTDIVSRAQWGGRDTKGSQAMQTPVKIVFIHHTAWKHARTQQEGCEITRAIQNMHMDDNKWDDIGYNFLVAEDGHVFEARGWDRVGAHTKGWNAVSVAFSIMGNFDKDISPDPRALKAVQEMIQLGIKIGKISQDYKLYGHCDVGATGCPGKNLYKIIKTWDHYSKEKPKK